MSPRLLLQTAFRRARAEIALLAALFVITGGIGLFLEIADDSREADGQAFDHAILQALHSTPGDPAGPWWVEEGAVELTSLGGVAVLGLFALFAVGFLLLQRKRLSAALLTLGLAGGVGWSEGLKALFGRARPPADYQAVETINASFPSGHALLSTVFYLSIGVMLARAFPQRRMKAYAIGAAVVLALLVGLSRIYLAAHWATDVLAGWSVGAAWAMALWLVAWVVQRRQTARKLPLHDEAEAVRAPAVIGE